MWPVSVVQRGPKWPGLRAQAASVTGRGPGGSALEWHLFLKGSQPAVLPVAGLAVLGVGGSSVPAPLSVLRLLIWVT